MLCVGISQKIHINGEALMKLVLLLALLSHHDVFLQHAKILASYVHFFHHCRTMRGRKEGIMQVSGRTKEKR